MKTGPDAHGRSPYGAAALDRPTALSFESGDELAWCLHTNTVPERGNEVPPIVGDDDAGAGSAGDLRDVRVVNAAAGPSRFVT